MSLQFIGEIGVFVPDRDAVRITAVDGDHVVDCYATPSALKAIGCTEHSDGIEVVRNFQRNRDTIEIAAMVKYRRALAPTMVLEVNADDLSTLIP
jgi:hypothetical protein